MNKSTLPSLILMLICFLPAACSTYQVKTDLDKSADFSSLRTFAWLNEQSISLNSTASSLPSPLLVKRIQQSVKQHLSNKQLRQANPAEDPDFLIKLTLESRDRAGVRARPHNFGLGLTYHYHDSLFGYSSVETYHYTEGSISLDFYLSKNQRPIWRGSANKNFLGFHADVSQQTVDKVISDILQSFPPPAI